MCLWLYVPISGDDTLSCHSSTIIIQNRGKTQVCPVIADSKVKCNPGGKPSLLTIWFVIGGGFGGGGGGEGSWIQFLETTFLLQSCLKENVSFWYALATLILTYAYDFFSFFAIYSDEHNTEMILWAYCWLLAGAEIGSHIDIL